MKFEELREGMLVVVRDHAAIEDSLRDVLSKTNWVAKVVNLTHIDPIGKHVDLEAGGMKFLTCTPEQDLTAYIPKPKSITAVNISTDDIKSRLASVGMKLVELKTHTGKNIVPTLEIKAYFLPELKEAN